MRYVLLNAETGHCGFLFLFPYRWFKILADIILGRVYSIEVIMFFNQFKSDVFKRISFEAKTIIFKDRSQTNLNKTSKNNPFILVKTIY